MDIAKLNECLSSMLQSMTDDKGNLLQYKMYKLKLKSTDSPYHYRRNGKLYVVQKLKDGTLYHKVQKNEYYTQRNSTSNNTNSASKSSNPSEQYRLTKEHFAYLEYNKI